MKLSTKTRYGLRAMIELAANSKQGPIGIKSIASRQKISVKYLEQLISVLKSAGFVRSIRGAKGGYVLTKRPEEIRLSEIFAVLEGPVITAVCVNDVKACEKSSDCVTREIWQQVQEAVYEILDSVTLKDMIDKINFHKGLNYQI